MLTCIVGQRELEVKSAFPLRKELPDASVFREHTSIDDRSLLNDHVALVEVRPDQLLIELANHLRAWVGVMGLPRSSKMRPTSMASDFVFVAL
jgi:hypothetical protein